MLQGTPVGVAAPARPGRIIRRRRPPALILAVSFLVVIEVAAATVRWWWPQGPDSVNVAATLLPPSLHHPFGTDDIGRDVFARVIEGGGISLTAALVTALVTAVIGGLFGVVAGLRPGPADTIVVRVADSLLAFPPLILAIAVAAALGPGLVSACIAITVSSSPYVTRIIRADVRRIRGIGFVEGSVALGVPPRRLVSRHVLPHVSSTLLIQVASVCSYTILALAGLGFIGLGAQPPTPEWGAMIYEGSAPLIAGQWWVSFFPGIGLLLVTTAAYVIADQLRLMLKTGGSGQG
jgi:peptide/nickel transport system permease protein